MNLPGDPVYLDHAATTPVRPCAIDAWSAWASQVGNPASVHAAGRRARAAVEQAREQVAELLGARPTEVVFTAGGTEADNMALKGLAWQRAETAPVSMLVSAIEHHAVLESAQWLSRTGQAEVSYLPVDSTGRLDTRLLAQELAAATSPAVISVMWANNEVGTIQPIDRVQAIASEFGAIVHTDAVQAISALPIDFDAAGVDAMTISGHKIGAPTGIGVLLAGQRVALTPVVHGGGQERGLRSGTVSVPLVCAFAAALAETCRQRESELARLSRLAQRLIALLGTIPGTHVVGPTDPAERLPGMVYAIFEGCESEVLVYLLDRVGIAVSAGAACQAGVSQPSHVLQAMGLTQRQSASGLRFSLGWTSDDADVDALAAQLPEAVQRARCAADAMAAR